MYRVLCARPQVSWEHASRIPHTFVRVGWLLGTRPAFDLDGMITSTNRYACTCSSQITNITNVTFTKNHCMHQRPILVKLQLAASTIVSSYWHLCSSIQTWKQSTWELSAKCKVRTHCHIPEPLPAAKTFAKMKSITFFLTLFLFTLLSTVAHGYQSGIPPADTRQACLDKRDGKNVVAAIEKFCKNINIV